MLIRFWLLTLIVIGPLAAQDPTVSQPDISPPPDPPAVEQPSSEQQPPVNSQADRVSPAETQKPERDVSIHPKKFARNFFSDQKKIWTFPAKVATGHHVAPTLAVLGVTGALIIGVDPYAGRYFRKHGDSFSGLHNVMTENRETATILLIPAGVYVTGLITKDKYTQRTGLLALEAWVASDLFGEFTRTAFRRTRPINIPVDGNYRNTWFKTFHPPFQASSSFPSGHSAWSFAVATVIARRHGAKHKWIPFVAYGLATLGAINRITSSQHFPSDHFFGAAAGYAIGRYVVLRQ